MLARNSAIRDSSISTSTVPSSSELAQPGRRDVVEELIEALGDPEPDAGRCDRRGQLVGPPAGGDPATVEEDDPVADLRDLVHVMRGEDDRDPFLVALPADEVADLDGDVRVERGRRLVQERDLRPGQEGLGQHHPRGLAGGEPLHRPSPQIPDAEPREQVPAPLRSLASIEAVQPAEDIQVLGDGQPPRQLRIGAGKAHLGEDLGAGRPPATCRNTGSLRTSA